MGSSVLRNFRATEFRGLFRATDVWKLYCDRAFCFYFSLTPEAIRMRMTNIGSLNLCRVNVARARARGIVGLSRVASARSFHFVARYRFNATGRARPSKLQPRFERWRDVYFESPRRREEITPSRRRVDGRASSIRSTGFDLGGPNSRKRGSRTRLVRLPRMEKNNNYRCIQLCPSLCARVVRAKLG